MTLAIKMVKRLTQDGNIPGVHFCTLNLEKSVQRVTEGLGWATSSRVLNKLIIVNKFLPLCNAESDIGNRIRLLSP